MVIRALGTAFVLCLIFISSAFAQPGPLRNGNFETGTLEGWTASGVNEGFVRLAREGSCFSYNNTEGLTLSGNFAAAVRSGGVGPTDSVGILTSDLFIASSSVTFKALSETEYGDAAKWSDDPVTFEVRLLDAADNVLLSQVVKTNLVALKRSADGPCLAE